jgi:nitrite reductase/ring-hydroxylating ferredoxin subunit
MPRYTDSMAGFTSVARISDFIGANGAFREGKIRRYFLEGQEIAISYWKGRFHAFSNLCPHNQFQLHFSIVDEDKVWCPIHYGVFDLETGARLGGPINICDLPIYAVRVSGEDVQVSLSD